MIWSPKFETMPRPELEKLQLERLKALVARVYEKVPFYRQAFQQKGITPDSIKSLADLSKLPFTSKQDFRDNYPLGLLAVPITNGDATLVAQLIGIATIFVWVFVTSFVVLAILKATMGIRVSEEEEYDGVDLSECGLEAYPEFTTAET